MLRRFFALIVILLFWHLATAAAQSLKSAIPDPIIIGDLMSYASYALYANPHREGWQLAVEEVNGSGGLLGRPIKVISRDDQGNPGAAARVAQELVTRDQAVLLMGTVFDHAKLAVSEFARQNKVLFITGTDGTDALTWEKGHRYAFRLGFNNYVFAHALAEAAAKTGAKRWVTVAPNYEYGRSMVQSFQEALRKLKPDVEFVESQWPMLGKIDAGPVVNALLQAKPDGIFNATFTSDLSQLLRQGNARGLFANRVVVSPYTGLPEMITPLGQEAPVGWITNGYPADEIQTPEHQAFVKAFREKYGHLPANGALMGYLLVKALAQAIEKTGKLETEALVGTLEGFTATTPIGPITLRAFDHQSTLGVWIGRTGMVSGAPKLVDWVYQPGTRFLPMEAEVKRRR